jgi:trimethylamine--corrinoid protein Co-methyltransferase
MRDARVGVEAGVHRPYIVRGIPTYDILSEESLVAIEATADRILAEIGIELRDDTRRCSFTRPPGPR